jgi:hypothetical protein
VLVAPADRLLIMQVRAPVLCGSRLHDGICDALDLNFMPTHRYFIGIEAPDVATPTWSHTIPRLPSRGRRVCLFPRLLSGRLAGGGFPLCAHIGTRWSQTHVGNTDDGKIARISCSPNVYIRVHKGTPLGPALRQMHPAHTFHLCSFMIY